MKKNVKYLFFVFVYFIPLIVNADIFTREETKSYDFGDIAYGDVKQYSWDASTYSDFGCSGSGATTETKNGNHFVYFSNNNKTVSDKSVTVTCVVYDRGWWSGVADKKYTWTFKAKFKGNSTPTTLQKDYNIFKGDTVDLKSDLKVKKITGFSHNTGSGYGTIKNSGCSTASGGTGACSLVFNTGTAVQNRQHKFTLTYVGADDDILYQATVYAYEMDTIRNLELGAIQPGNTVYGDVVSGATNFSCKTSNASVPATVTQSGNRIMVTSNNNSLDGYSDGKAVCTFKKDSKTYTYNYTYSLNPQTAQNVTKKYNAYPKDVIDLYKDLSIKSIISFSGEYNIARLSYSGCSKSSSSCKLTMASKLKTGDKHTFTMYYYDTSDRLKKASITVVEQSNSTTTDLDAVGAGSMVKVDINASDVTCTTVSSSGTIISGGGDEESGSSSLFEIIIEKISEWLFGVTIKNNNQTVIDYEDITVECTGVPLNGDGREHSYVYNFDLSGSNTPVKNTKSYVLFADDVLNFNELLGIKNARTAVHGVGSSYKSLIINGCSNTTNCSVSLDKSKMKHNREHELTLTYVNSADVLYETKVVITEKDPAETTKAYPGIFGFCEFDSDWELTSWADSSGKNYTFYESKAKDAVLPKCKVNSLYNTENLPVEFKGWTKGYKPGDALTTKSTCGTNLLAPGKKVDFGQVYAPCYEMKPHIRVSINSGTLKNDGNFEFRSSDLTYIRFGNSYTEKVELPDVEYTGFQSNSELDSWTNYSTGEVKKPGDKVPLDGSVWYATTTRSLASIDLYKTVGLNEVSIFTVKNMNNCTLSSGSSYISVKHKSGDCEVKGLKVTPVGEYADVNVKLKDGTVRTYKFSVVDRSGIADEDNGVFIVDTEDNIEAGKNDETTLNGFKTNQCDDFFITIENYDRFHYANAKHADIGMYSGKFEVYQLCADDDANYVALCLDPGRRGPQEPTAGAYSKTFTFKGSTVTKSGLDYIKTDDIQRDSLMGKLVSYIVNNYDIDKFDQANDTMRKQRAAAHVAIRAMAIHTGFSASPDPSDEIYASNYYPYMGLSQAIADSLSDKDITLAEAKKIVNNGKNGYGFEDWVSGVDTMLINTLSEFDSVPDLENEGFTRTIDDTDYQVIDDGKGYYVNYKGTITAPKGATAKLTACSSSKSTPYGVSCKINNNNGNGWVKVDSAGDINTYYYDVTVKVPDASKFNPPTEKEEKDLSFQITYSGGHDIVNSFIASPKNGSANVQRMLIFSTTNPKIYIYFSTLPKNCDLPVLDPKKCPDDDDGAVCEDNKDKGLFNEDLFKAAGCCRYLLDEKSYLFASACTAECTSSTLTSICEYAKYGREKADFYEVNEGYKKSKPKISNCVVNTKEYYKNDSGSLLSSLADASNFTKTDDAGNIINVEEFNNNRYCQVTCKEDWQFTMDSFGNFIGSNAVAAGTYFQIVSNDVFIGAKRTCYSTFINYDRFMNNIVELSDELVKYYNSYSTWSHVWTDVNKQTLSSAKNNTLSSSDSGQGVKCVEYWDKCPQKTSSASDNYYWSSEVNNCRRVPNYGSKNGSGDDGANCVAKPTSYQGHAYSDGKVTYTNSGANNDSTKCTFERTYCDGTHVEKSGDKEEFYDGTKKCRYKTYKTRDNKGKDKIDKITRNITTSRVNYVKNPNILGKCDTDYELRNDAEGNPKCYSKATYCPTGYTEVGGTCYSETCQSGYSYYSDTQCYRYICASGYTDIGGTCYSNSCPSGYSSYSSTECWKYAYHDSATKTLTMKPDYETETLKCKVYGKGYDYKLTTETKNKVSGKGTDVYYSTKQYDKLASENLKDDEDRDSIANIGTNNRQNKPVPGDKVVDVYSNSYTHNCTIVEADYSPGAKGSSSCKQTGLANELVTAKSYKVTNQMFCTKYADLSGSDLDKAFCKAGTESTSNNKDAKTENAGSDYKKLDDAFKYIQESFKDHSEREANSARSSMTSYHTQIYSHAEDLFDCQNFELHNRTDDSDDSKENNPASTDSIMNMTRKYVNINTDFDPIATYTYDEDFFMSRVGAENILVQYTEKNDELYNKAIGKTYGASTNKAVNATITIPSETDPKGKKVDTKLYRNYKETSYYNPINLWKNAKQVGDSSKADATERLNTYHDKRYYVTTPDKASKKITLCTVGPRAGSGQVHVAFNTSSLEWTEGSCYQVNVDYKKVHYVKTSLSNSSYYKNKGYWYVRGGDSKIHGDTISGAIKKFNGLNLGTTYKNNTDEHKKWSMLGSFNVFPISMATPRNLYQYSYTFGNVGSYYDGTLGRIMGKDNSIIQNNKRTCFYEVFEEVCLCCGYLIEPGDLVEQVAGGSGSYKEYRYVLSDTSKTGEGTHGTITFYSNSISLGDVDLGRNSDTLASNWSDASPFMYNGDVMSTDKGKKLIDNIEYTGENIYSRKPEYAYYLTPDTLKVIRSYNESVGYDMNLERLYVADVKKIECDGYSCKDGSTKDINFQHYGSNFLKNPPKGINLNSSGVINSSYTNTCYVKDSEYSGSYDMAAKMENGKCRWVDYIETNQTYYNPTSKTSSNTWFRLAFK